MFILRMLAWFLAPLVRCAAGTYTQLLAIDGKSMSRAVSKTADTALSYGDANSPIALPAANLIAAENYTNDGDDTATITATAGHTLVTGTADLYWAAGVRYGCSITVADNAVDLSGGAGDDLPATGTACYLANVVQVNVAIDGDAVSLIGVVATQRAHVAFHDADDDVIRAVELLANEPDIYTEDDAGANPYTGDPITVAYATCGTTTAATLQINVLVDSTP